MLNSDRFARCTQKRWGFGCSVNMYKELALVLFLLRLWGGLWVVRCLRERLVWLVLAGLSNEAGSGPNLVWQRHLSSSELSAMSMLTFFESFLFSCLPPLRIMMGLLAEFGSNLASTSSLSELRSIVLLFLDELSFITSLTSDLL